MSFVDKQNNLIIIDKSLNSTFEILHPLDDGTGDVWTPDTSVLIDIYPAYSPTQIITAAAMAVKNSIAGLYKYLFSVINYPTGYYKYIVRAIDGGKNYSEEGSILIVNGTLIGVNNKISGLIDLTTTRHKSDGEDEDPDTSIVCTVYNGSSDVKLIDNEEMVVRDGKTGYFEKKDGADISEWPNGTHNCVYISVNGGKTKITVGTLPIKSSASTNAFPSLPVPSYRIKYDLEDPAITSNFENGIQQTRSKFTRLRRGWTLRWPAMTNADRATLMDFFNSVFGGSASFSWTDSYDDVEYTVRFAGPVKEININTKHWSMDIEIKEV